MSTENGDYKWRVITYYRKDMKLKYVVDRFVLDWTERKENFQRNVAVQHVGEGLYGGRDGIVTINITTLYLLTYLFTPWKRDLLEKLNGLQLVKKSPAFYGTRRFITAFKSDRQLSLS